jgi:N-acetyl-anhydromuramyl-L-alanine amidase AmpD
VPSALNELKGRYSSGFVEILERMLQFHSKLRPKFIDVIFAIEEDNNLHEDTETSDGRQVSVVCESQNKGKMESQYKN